MALDREQVAEDFERAVNMSAAELADWLETAESQKVGFKGKAGERGESLGHASGRRIASILRKRPDSRDDADYQHMRKTVGFIRRHGAQRPENIYTSRWRYSLMNWGHDPVKEEQQ
jgi:hypothetical protein